MSALQWLLAGAAVVVFSAGFLAGDVWYGSAERQNVDNVDKRGSGGQGCG